MERYISSCLLIECLVLLDYIIFPVCFIPFIMSQLDILQQDLKVIQFA